MKYKIRYILIFLVIVISCNNDPVGYLGITEDEPPIIMFSDIGDTLLLSSDIEIKADVFDLFGVSKVEFYLDDKCCFTANKDPYTFKIQLNKIFQSIEDELELKVKATDNFGNISISKSIKLMLAIEELAKDIQFIHVTPHSIYIKDMNGNIHVQGQNFTCGSLGIGSNEDSFYENWQEIAYIRNALKIRTYYGFSMYRSHQSSIALLPDNTLWSWGYNNYNNLGYSGNSNKPTKIQNLDGIIDMDISNTNGIAVDRNGEVWIWGLLGGGISSLFEINNIPIKCDGQTNVKKVFACSNAYFLLRNDGTLWSWGCDLFGMLGLDLGNSISTVITPTRIRNLPKVIDLTIGYYKVYAITEDGVWAWGLGEYLGIEDCDDEVLCPVRISNLDQVVKIIPTRYVSIALKNDGTIWKWGEQSFNIKPTWSSTVPIQDENYSNIIDIYSADLYNILIDDKGFVHYCLEGDPNLMDDFYHHLRDRSTINITDLYLRYRHM